jgi:2-keto-3-deoxy-L-rhamnonate aldolase RhmA
LDASSPSRFAARLRGGEALLGTVLTLPGVALAELLAEPLDFVWIDLEHGALDVADVAPLAVATRAGGCAPIVRLASHERLAAILDAGIDGVVAPHVESAAQARRLADRLRHPPHGSRGFAARRANGYGRRAGGPPTAPLLIAQIESAAGVEAAAEIAAVDGVAALVVGCADLALALDGTPAPDSLRLRAAIGRVQDAAAAAGIASGIAGPDDAALLGDLAGGRSTLLVCSADVRIYARAVDELAQRVRTSEPEAIRVGA